MTALIRRECARCGKPLVLGDLVVPVWLVTHVGRVHTEADPTPSSRMAHVTCPDVP